MWYCGYIKQLSHFSTTAWALYICSRALSHNQHDEVHMQSRIFSHHHSTWMKPALVSHRARTGGAVTKCVFAFVHTAVHLLVALMLMVLLELGVETCIR